MTEQQPPLFATSGSSQFTPPITQIKPITASSSLSSAASAYHDYMIRQGFSKHTIKAFAGDLRLLQKYFGNNVVVSGLSTKELNDFLTWLLHYRGVPCSPKSYARRVTTLKSFFGWLADTKVLPIDPAASLVHIKLKTPLPQYLKKDQIEALLKAAEEKMEEEKPDARPYLLAALVLQTGMKKAECVGLALDDIERNTEPPSVLIRYNNPRLQHKERRLAIASDLLPVMEKYIEQYQPQERLFECTPRNLEYVLTDISEAAKLPNQASFEMLRWTSALRDYRDGMDHDRLRRKMGLSKITWRETADKLAKLTDPL